MNKHSRQLAHKYQKTVLVMGILVYPLAQILEQIIVLLLISLSGLGGAVSYVVLLGALTNGSAIFAYLIIATIASYDALRRLKVPNAFVIAFFAGGLSCLVAVMTDASSSDGDFGVVSQPWMYILTPIFYLVSHAFTTFFVTDKYKAALVIFCLALPLYIIAPFSGSIVSSIDDKFDPVRMQRDTTSFRDALYKEFTPYTVKEGVQGVESTTVMTDAYKYGGQKVSDKPSSIELSVLVDFAHKKWGLVLWQNAKFPNLKKYVGSVSTCKLWSLFAAKDDLEKYGSGSDIAVGDPDRPCRNIGTTANGRTVWMESTSTDNRITLGYTEIDNTVIVIGYRMYRGAPTDKDILSIVQALEPVEKSEIKPSYDFAPYLDD